MKKSFLIYFVALLSGVMFYSCKNSDADLQKNVNQALATTSTGVTSSVKDGVITLMGVVDSEEAKNNVGMVAQSIKDVKSVVNNVQVQTSSAPVITITDSTLADTIKAGLNSAGFSDVIVVANNGEVTLAGDVEQANLTKVLQIANQANPAKVINNLNIKK